MNELARDELAAVTGGGASSTQIDVGPVRYRRTTSDYRTCVDAVKHATREQFPVTRRYGLFGSDQNAAPRGEATNQNLREVCGLPPTR